MATFSISNIAIKGISCCVPKNKELNKDLTIMSIEEIEKFIDATGVEERRIANENTCTSDLCFHAAEKLMSDLNWAKEEIEILVFVSQTADYILPVTSTILQNRLGLSQDCIAFDVPLGCSGYVYGISIISSMMKSTGLKKGLLLAGDTISKIISKNDKTTTPLFGDAGSATALEFETDLKKTIFELGSDGSGKNAIIINDGGVRNQINNNSLEYIEIEKGVVRNSCQLVLEGMDVFSFGITQVPKSVNALLNKYEIDKDNIDFFIFHQANLMMNKMIAKKLKLSEDKVPYSLKKYGNTSSATIPLTIVTELKDKILGKEANLLLCGFGVGLSWGTMLAKKIKIESLNLIEI
jgi:3-oxoacyl-[acyl-carrier-protein] synthase-3